MSRVRLLTVAALDPSAVSLEDGVALLVSANTALIVAMNATAPFGEVSAYSTSGRPKRTFLRRPSTCHVAVVPAAIARTDGRVSPCSDERAVKQWLRPHPNASIMMMAARVVGGAGEVVLQRLEQRRRSQGETDGDEWA